MTNLSSEYEGLRALFDGWLRAEVDSWEHSLPLDLAMAYSLLAPGKRLRPVLALACTAALGIELERIKPFCLALEYIHTFSLVHDDLPAMDNDLLRRGQPTCHVKFGEDVALLAGDCLLARSFALLEIRDEESAVVCAWLSLLTSTCIELCRGQMLDLMGMKGRGDRLAPEENQEAALVERHMKKTGALIIAALLGPCELVRARSDYARSKTALAAYGEKLGLLFQITDDILDATASTAELGKTAGKDGKLGCSTYVSVFGLDRARELAVQTADAAQEALSGLLTSPILSALPQQLLNRSR